MNIWIFSSGDFESNESVDPFFIGSIKKKLLNISFIPTSNEEAQEYYDEFIDRVGSYCYANFQLINLEKGLSEHDRESLLDSDLIYISGGNTFDLLYNLRKSNLFDDLRDYVENGGCLAGHSAGAIVLTENINTAAFPPEDCDTNDVGIDNFKAMDLVDFELFPHYENLSFYKKPLQLYTRHLKKPLYAIEDGGAIHIDMAGITFFGSVTAYVKGKFVKICDS